VDLDIPSTRTAVTAIFAARSFVTNPRPLPVGPAPRIPGAADSHDTGCPPTWSQDVALPTTPRDAPVRDPYPGSPPHLRSPSREGNPARREKGEEREAILVVSPSSIKLCRYRSACRSIASLAKPFYWCQLTRMTSFWHSFTVQQREPITKGLEWTKEYTLSCKIPISQNLRASPLRPPKRPQSYLGVPASRNTSTQAP
jgi:hypothetical protein